jgi:hypothetical protein
MWIRYRGRKSNKYHAALDKSGSDKTYIQEGRVLCGVRIKIPSYTVTNDAVLYLKVPFCRNCNRILDSIIKHGAA